MNDAILKKFNVNVSGKGTQTMLFAHGVGCDQTIWRYVVPAFEEDYRVVLFDHAGCAHSGTRTFNQEQYSTLQDFASDVVAIIKALDVEDVIYVGHSAGSMIGMLAAIEAPEVFRKVIMIAPSPCYINHPGYNGGFDLPEAKALLQLLKENLHQWSDTTAPLIMGNSERPELTEELKNRFKSADHHLLYHFAELAFLSDLRSSLEKLTIPTLIMQCSMDLFAPIEVGEFMHRQIPDSKLVVMNATGHCAHLSEPEETVQVIKEYLAANG